MAHFNYKEYLNAPSTEEAQWDADKKGFTIVVGTTKTSFQNIMDKAGMALLRYAKFHIRNDGTFEVLLFYLEPVCCSMSSSNCCFLTCI